MNTKEINKGNKLIWEFMGEPSLGWIPSKLEDYKFIWYHTLWDKLMPVVEKIETDLALATMMYVNSWDNRGRYSFRVYKELDNNGNIRNLLLEKVSNSKIEAVWYAVIEFIKWYNKEK